MKPATPLLLARCAIALVSALVLVSAAGCDPTRKPQQPKTGAALAACVFDLAVFRSGVSSAPSLAVLQTA